MATGGIAAFIQIAETLIKLTKELRTCIRKIQYAPKEVADLHLEALNFSASLQWFHDLADTWVKSIEGSADKEARNHHLEGLIRVCRTVEKGFERLLVKCSRNSTQNSRLQQYIDRVRWYLWQRHVTGLRLSVQTAKLDIGLFATFLMCEDQRKRIRELEKHSREVPQELRQRM